MKMQGKVTGENCQSKWLELYYLKQYTAFVQLSSSHNKRGKQNKTVDNLLKISSSTVQQQDTDKHTYISDALATATPLLDSMLSFLWPPQ